MANGRQFEPGDTVQIIAGGYRDFTGVVRRYQADADRLMVTIAVLGRETAIPIAPEGVERIREN